MLAFDEEVRSDAELGVPTPRLSLGIEPVTIDRSGGFGAMLETLELPVVRLYFDYGHQTLSACDVRDRFFYAASGGTRTVLRDRAKERQAGCVLEGFGAVDLECLPDHAVPPDVGREARSIRSLTDVVVTLNSVDAELS